jgi:hypothetical protein
MNRQVTACVLAAALAAITCGRGSGTLTELQRARSEKLDVVLLSPRDGLRHAIDTFTIEFRAASDATLVDVGTVHGSATMPMSGAPMLGGIEVKRTSVPGRYEAATDLSMAGTWRITLEWRGPAGAGSVTFSARVG